MRRFGGGAVILFGLLLPCAVGAAPKNPPCLAHYQLDRGTEGTVPAGLPAPQQFFVTEQTCTVAHPSDPAPATCRVGTVRNGARRRYPAQQIIDSLLYSHVIETMLHVGADFCRTRIDESTTEYRAQFSGTHQYCTNACLTAPLRFTVIIAKTSGLVTVQE